MSQESPAHLVPVTLFLLSFELHGRVQIHCPLMENVSEMADGCEAFSPGTAWCFPEGQGLAVSSLGKQLGCGAWALPFLGWGKALGPG